jgi:hypothetical protein
MVWDSSINKYPEREFCGKHPVLFLGGVREKNKRKKKRIGRGRKEDENIGESEKEGFLTFIRWEEEERGSYEERERGETKAESGQVTGSIQTLLFRVTFSIPSLSLSEHYRWKRAGQNQEVRKGR